MVSSKERQQGWEGRVAQQGARDFNGWLQVLGEAVQADCAVHDPLQKQVQSHRILDGLSPADINARAAPDRQDPLKRFAAHVPAGYRFPGAPSWQWQRAAQLGRSDEDKRISDSGTQFNRLRLS